jgi:hypothetical protein
MDRNTFYSDTISAIDITFSSLPVFWKALVVIGSISTIVCLILLVIIASLMFESKMKDNDHDLSEYDDFLNEFANGKKEEEDEYPSLPKIKDFDGNFLKNLMQIDVLP